jgi:hypothetical protein
MVWMTCVGAKREMGDKRADRRTGIFRQLSEDVNMFFATESPWKWLERKEVVDCDECWSVPEELTT